MKKLSLLIGILCFSMVTVMAQAEAKKETPAQQNKSISTVEAKKTDANAEHKCNHNHTGCQKAAANTNTEHKCNHGTQANAADHKCCKQKSAEAGASGHKCQKADGQKCPHHKDASKPDASEKAAPAKKEDSKTK